MNVFDVIRPGDCHVIEHGFVSHFDMFFSDAYVPFGVMKAFDMVRRESFTVIAVRQLKNETFHTSPGVMFLIRHTNGSLCNTYVWGDNEGHLAISTDLYGGSRV